MGEAADVVRSIYAAIADGDTDAVLARYRDCMDRDDAHREAGF